MFTLLNSQLEDVVSLMRKNDISSCEIPFDGGQLLLELASSGVTQEQTPQPVKANLQDALSPEMGVLAEVLVKEGETVENGAALGFVHVGPLRFVVKAPVAGVVLHSLVTINQVVGYHQPIFQIKSNA